MADNVFLKTIDLQIATDKPIAIPDLSLAPGELLWLETPGVGDETVATWFDTLMGLRQALKGKVLVDGRSWPDLPPWEQDVLRRDVRRVYREGGWISNLDIAENITLSERHHTGRPMDDIMNEAETLARCCGLPGVPPGRPAGASRKLLQSAQWVRALMGRPRLLLIDGDLDDQDPPVVEQQAAVLAEKRSQGVACIWVASKSEPYSWLSDVRRGVLTVFAESACEM